jgi:phenylalanyl-tRNA synthetase alpha chain
LQNNIADIEKEALDQIGAADSKDALDEISIRYLGRKGALTGFLRNISSLPEDERPAAGKNANLLKIKLEKALKAAESGLNAVGEKGPGIDVTLPGRPAVRGALHPITQVLDEICGIFMRLGFDIAEGPEVETDYYNF